MKNFKTFLAAMLLLLLGTTLPMYAGGYVKVQIISLHEDGITPQSSAHVNNGNRSWVSSKFTITVQPAAINTYYFKENLIGIYRDAECTQLVTTAIPPSTTIPTSTWTWTLKVDPTFNNENIVHLYSTSAEADSADPDVLYALFGYPKVLSADVHNAIIRDPSATGSAYIDFHMANFTDLTQVSWKTTRYNYTNYGQATNNGRTYIQAENIVRWQMSVTSKNIHTGTNSAATCAQLRALDLKNTSIKLVERDLYFYVDLQPKFTLATDALDWSYDGETLVETYDVGNEVAASQRSRLQNKYKCRSV